MKLEVEEFSTTKLAENIKPIELPNETIYRIDSNNDDESYSIYHKESKISLQVYYEKKYPIDDYKIGVPEEKILRISKKINIYGFELPKTAKPIDIKKLEPDILMNLFIPQECTTDTLRLVIFGELKENRENKFIIVNYENQNLLITAPKNTEGFETHSNILVKYIMSFKKDFDTCLSGGYDIVFGGGSLTIDNNEIKLKGQSGCFGSVDDDKKKELIPTISTMFQELGFDKFAWEN